MDIVLIKFKRPVGLTGVELLSSIEVHQVLMVIENNSGEWGSLEVMSPSVESVDNTEELATGCIFDNFVQQGKEIEKKRHKSACHC